MANETPNQEQLDEIYRMLVSLHKRLDKLEAPNAMKMKPDTAWLQELLTLAARIKL